MATELNINPEQIVIDSSLNAKNFGNEELTFNQTSVENVALNQKDVTDVETAAGNEDPTNIETDVRSEKVSANFDERDGSSVDISSDVREGELNQDVTYYEYEQLNASLLNPQVTSENEATPSTPEALEPIVPEPKPEVPETPIIPEPEVDDIASAPMLNAVIKDLNESLDDLTLLDTLNPLSIDTQPQIVAPDIIAPLGTLTNELDNVIAGRTNIVETSGDDVSIVSGNYAYSTDYTTGINTYKVMDTGDGNDTVSIGGYLETTVRTGSGDDKVISRLTNGAIIDVGDGNNKISIINGLRGGDIAHTSTITALDGDDKLIVGEHISGEVNIDLGDGDNTISGEGALLYNVNVNTGAGDDRLILSGQITGSASFNYTPNIDLGDGNNTISIGAYALHSNILAGSGDDTLIVGTNLSSDTNANLGDGDNIVSIGSGVLEANITTGNGDDTINVKTYLANNSVINVGDGDNTINIGTDINGSKIEAGSGDDKVSIGGNIACYGYYDTYVSGINLGDGNNSLNIGGNVDGTATLAAKLTAGSGDDILNIGGNVNITNIDLGDGDNTVSIKGVVNNGSSITSGNGNDTVIIGNSITNSSSIDLGDGNNILSIDGNVDSSYINSGSGDDTVIISGDLNGTTSVGDGNNTVSINGDVGQVYLMGGNGNDTIIIGGDSKGSLINLMNGEKNTLSIKGNVLEGSNIYGGEGGDKVIIGGDVTDTSMYLGGGDDYVYINGVVKQDSELDGGAGNDTLYLSGSQSDYTISTSSYDRVTYSVITTEITWEQYFEAMKDPNNQYNSYSITDKEGNSSSITNFENIVFTEDPKTYEYELSLSAGLSDRDGSETLSNITLDNLPEDAILKDINGNELLANEDGSYTVVIDENGEAKLTIESSNEIPKEELESIRASVTSTESNGGDTSTTQTNPIFSNDIDMSNLSEDMIHNGIIDMKSESFDKLMITLEDVMNVGNKSITITGADIDKLCFQDTVNEDGTQNQWSSVCETNLETGLTECTYTNSGDSSLQVKVEQPISDGITC